MGGAPGLGQLGALGVLVRPAYRRGCTSNSGGCSSASSMAVMPRDQMSHSSLYPPFRATAATSGAILGAETLREPGVTPGGKGGDSLAWAWGAGERQESGAQREPDAERNIKAKRDRNKDRHGEFETETDRSEETSAQRDRGKRKTQERANESAECSTGKGRHRERSQEGDS